MAAGVEDEPPFSPSDFLNLFPATPCLNSDGPAAAGPAAAAAAVQDDDDLVLPSITRVLMEDQEEGINPDHSAAALLEAQQPFADILSLSAAGNTEAPPPFSDDAPEPAAAFVANDATWPYDPVELAHQLLLGQQQQQQQHHRASSSADNNNSMVITMEMLNQAFLKGMQEANKFLPMPMPTASNTRLLTHLSDGRGRKNKHSSNWDGLEAETGRSCKLMVPETEEASVKDEESIQNGYQSLAEQMMSLNITISDVDTKAETEKKKNTRKGRSTTNVDEAVDLRSLLIHCAQDIATGDRLHATQLLGEIKQRSSPTGDATQRLAHCFSKGLEARFAGTGSQVYKSLLSRRIPALELHKAYRLYLTVCCFQSAAFIFSDLNIRKAVAGRKKLHIVEYGEHYGIQWPILLRCMTTWKDGPPEVKITSIVLPQPGFRPSARIEQTKRRLGNFAHHCGVPFKFHSIVAKWETVCAHDLDIEPDEVLIVNGLFHLGKLMDEGGDDIDSPSPRDIVLGNISKMRPDMLILCTENSSYNTPFFVTRFQEALFHYSAMFDMMDATSPRDSGERILVEQELFGQCALNAIACEGSDRVERPESYRQWQVRNIRAGLRQLPLDPDIAKAVSKKVNDVYHKDFVIDVDQQWLLQGWKGRILYAMSTWVASKS